MRAELLCTLLMAGCAGVLSGERRIESLRTIVDQARSRGAYRCAPEELALAEAHLDFASTDLAQGQLDSARQHLVLGETNAQAALDLSPESACSSTPKPGDQDGDGLSDALDRCPAQAEDFDGVEDEDGCPEDQDSDGDSFADSVDLCVASPEDKDGFEDTDGCPEEDNDLDQLADALDTCPNEPEDPDGFADTDGCPDLDNDADGIADLDDTCPNEHGLAARGGCPKVYDDVLVTDQAVVITQQVHFETNRAAIKPESYGLLDTVAAALTDFPAIAVEVQGHTDDKGPDQKNLTLSQARADAVRLYLVSRGVEPFRLTARGYGETKPIDSNKTNAGRAQNRRVEFVRTDEGRKSPDKSDAGASVP